ncbi:MAG: N-acetylmuramoyl-L-alanine amidase [Candidatus Nanoarchaeia archaeon]|nr:N-acetylmuramoyl-L-alanine amidase [Candidatus Nanoarchaeia archaeon]
MKNLLTFLDSGHGGLIGSKYQTPSKMFKHTDGSVAMEGVINRQVKEALKSKMRAADLTFYDISNTERDILLKQRVSAANDLIYKKDEYTKLLYLSIHSNASLNHRGTGFEVWTSPGQTKSDQYAQLFAEQIRTDFKYWRFRADKSDGDLDKESKFYVLVHTRMPSILVELLFFDNPEDWDFIRTPEYIDRISTTLCKFLEQAQATIQ